jgi:hypothetical protein
MVIDFDGRFRRSNAPKNMDLHIRLWGLLIKYGMFRYRRVFIHGAAWFPISYLSLRCYCWFRVSATSSFWLLGVGLLVYRLFFHVDILCYGWLTSPRNVQ